ncbi:MAG: glycosyltransferase family 2 protein [Deltaproteobacteria bacterium]|nr:glycosyltransferase family 2 protein [Deltaproteobacteria bacterium]MBW2110602.1 glycosyltransferase family 2 protein [Deltaproteobacteria bacterium]MBW2354780.1 glycosyltransferase family 2 protein [Deltaproteobacteria bacterium]
MKLDIVIPIYNEEETLPFLHDRLVKVCEALPDTQWRVIYVNDGSTDQSLEIMVKQRETDPRFAIVELSRNFGHQAAITAGLHHSSGDAVIVMDGDLQDPPELIPELISCWRGEANVVMARRRSRRDKGLRRVGFNLFHRVFTWITDFPVPPDTGIFGLLDRQAAEELKRLPEQNRYFPGLRSWVGLNQQVVYYDRDERGGGKPKQSLKRLARYALDAVFSFSYKPLRVMTSAGIVISAVGFMLACFFIIKRLMGVEVAQTGFTTLVTLMLFLGGIQLIAIGLVGEYLARIYDEVKQRPLFIVRQTHGLEKTGRNGG